MAAIFGEGKIFGKLQRLHSLDTLWVENFDEIALSRKFVFCHFGQKFENSKRKLQRLHSLYPVGRKFRRNRSISHG